MILKLSRQSNLVSTITRARTQNWFLHCKMKSFSSKMLIFYLIVGVLYWFYTCWTLFWGLKLALSWWTKRTPPGRQASNFTLVPKGLMKPLLVKKLSSPAIYTSVIIRLLMPPIRAVHILRWQNFWIFDHLLPHYRLSRGIFFQICLKN